MEILASKPDVVTAVFDQCRFGLETKVLKMPVKKRTRLITIMPEIVTEFHEKYCSGDHVHQVVEGSEGGVKRSTHAQRYPPQMCETVAACVKDWIESTS